MKDLELFEGGYVIASGSADLTCPTNQVLNFGILARGRGGLLHQPNLSNASECFLGLPTIQINDCTMSLPKKLVI